MITFAIHKSSKLLKMQYTRSQIRELLLSEGSDMENLLRQAAEVKSRTIGNGIFLRGLIEYSNVCRKNCLYCGIRRDADCHRYTLTNEQVLECARYAADNNYGSVVIQGGENTSPQFIDNIEYLLTEIKSLSGGKLGITLSLGEQTKETYARWFAAGAHRYLLRIESSYRQLYSKIHPNDSTHSFEARLAALGFLRETGYQVGTGVMIGLPMQSVDTLAGDLMFMRDMDIDMCGMGPYVESHGTPLAEVTEGLHPIEWRFDMTLKMIAVLRLMMPSINIAATTALQAIDPMGRLRAVQAGANVIMPNTTPQEYRGDYLLYDNKPMSFDSKLLEANIRYGEWGDSHHFTERTARR
jgi:biotin synthase